MKIELSPAEVDELINVAATLIDTGMTTSGCLAEMLQASGATVHLDNAWHRIGGLRRRRAPTRHHTPILAELRTQWADVRGSDAWEPDDRGPAVRATPRHAFGRDPLQAACCGPQGASGMGLMWRWHLGTLNLLGRYARFEVYQHTGPGWEAGLGISHTFCGELQIAVVGWGWDAERPLRPWPQWGWRRPRPRGRGEASDLVWCGFFVNVARPVRRVSSQPPGEEA